MNKLRTWLHWAQMVQTGMHHPPSACLPRASAPELWHLYSEDDLQVSRAVSSLMLASSSPNGLGLRNSKPTLIDMLVISVTVTLASSREPWIFPSFTHSVHSKLGTTCTKLGIRPKFKLQGQFCRQINDLLINSLNKPLLSCYIKLKALWVAKTCLLVTMVKSQWVW